MSKVDSGTLRFECWDTGHYEDDPVYKASGSLTCGTFVELSVPLKLMPNGSGEYVVTLKIKPKEAVE
jgi:hypothetical protein